MRLAPADVGLFAGLPLVTTGICIGGSMWQVTAVQSQDALLDASNAFEHFPFGLLLWESAVGLASVLAADPNAAASRKVLELGAGVGLTGIVARSLGAVVSQTDHQKAALRLAERNAAQNCVPGIRRFLADWRSWTHNETYDLILGADITYERPLHFYLEAIFNRSLAPGGTILLSDPGRPQTLEFAAHLELRGWQIAIDTLSVEPVQSVHAKKDVEITILRLAR